MLLQGAKGGYTLAKPPEEITLRQVIELVEGPYMLSRCQKEEYSCGREHCRLHNIYEKISEDVRRELESYTFAMICAPHSCGCQGESRKHTSRKKGTGTRFVPCLFRLSAQVREGFGKFFPEKKKSTGKVENFTKAT